MAAHEYIGNEIPLVTALGVLVDRSVKDRKRFALEFVGEDGETGQPRWTIEHDFGTGTLSAGSLQEVLEGVALIVRALEAGEQAIAALDEEE